MSLWRKQHSVAKRRLPPRIQIRSLEPILRVHRRDRISASTTVASLSCCSSLHRERCLPHCDPSLRRATLTVDERFATASPTARALNLSQTRPHLP